MRQTFARLTGLKTNEVTAGLMSAGSFFLLLFCWYILRSIRDEVGAHLGREITGELWIWVFYTMLLVTPVYMWISARFTRKTILPIVYRFFGATLLGFALFFLVTTEEQRNTIDLVEQIFYVWCSVFALFVVSMFWAFMTDSFRHESSKRMFGVIAIGGTLGAISGSSAVTFLAELIPPAYLLMAAIVLLEGCCQLLRVTRKTIPDEVRTVDETSEDEAPISGNYIEGLAVVVRSPYLLLICGFIACYCITQSFLYFMKLEIAGDFFEDRGERRAFFGQVELYTNFAALFLQCFLTGRMMTRVGIGPTLIALPILATLGFIALAFNPILGVIVAAEVARRAGNFAFAKPAREVLYTLVPRWQRYKSKVFIDTVVYRGSDVGGSELYNMLQSGGLALKGIALAAIPITLLWAGLSIMLGALQKHRAKKLEA